MTQLSPSLCVSVLLPRPLKHPYTYAVPSDLSLKVGDFVQVPFQNKDLIGIVWTSPAPPDKTKKITYKPLKQKLEVPALPPLTCRFIQWVSDYTLAPLGAVLKMVMSVPSALKPADAKIGYVLSDQEVSVRLTHARKKVLNTLEESDQALMINEIATKADVSPAIVRAMVQADLLRAEEISDLLPKVNAHVQGQVPTLSAKQETVSATLRDQVRGKKYVTTLLDGVTGSGKTEVYFEAIAEALSLQKQILVLLPEISLSPPWFERFQKRFGVTPAVWHSEISSSKKRQTWQGVISGETPLVVGARSALFLPFKDLGLIVIDEEHDPSYKQEEQVIYQARDMAITRGYLGKIPVILSSATPSLETLVNCEQGRYQHLHLPTRHGGMPLPEVSLIDMRTIDLKSGTWLSPSLCQAIQETAEAKEQTLLFLNRRGYAPLSLCRKCGHRHACPDCSSWLVFHKSQARLLCHHCGHRISPPTQCPECEADDMLAPCGPGVERIAEEITALFPDLRTAVMASDVLSSAKETAAFLNKIQNRDVDLIIGTQMISKGHHFPWLTLVGVVDADLGLNGTDLRAGERTYQLLHQVAGRAGRENRPGRVLMQTYMPDHPVMTALQKHDRDAFFRLEKEARQSAEFPPFGRLVALIVSGPHEPTVKEASRMLAQHAPRQYPEIEILGPAPAPMAKVRGHYRWRLLLKAPKEIATQKLIAAWLAPLKLPSTIRLQVDVDPCSFM